MSVTVPSIAGRLRRLSDLLARQATACKATHVRHIIDSVVGDERLPPLRADLPQHCDECGATLEYVRIINYFTR